MKWGHVIGGRRRQVGTVLALMATLASGGVALTGTAAATAPSTLKYVPGGVTNLDKATLLGALPVSSTLTVGVGVQPPNLAAEKALDTALYNPASPEYHHFLTPAEFQQRFGITPATQSAVSSWLTSTGARIAQSYDGGSYVQITGTVAQIQRLFHVQINDYTHAGKAFFSTATPPEVPSTLPIDGVLGLDNFHKFTLANLHSKRLTSSELKAARHAAVTSQAGDQIAFTPQDLWGVYNMPGASDLTNAKGQSDPAAVASSTAALGQGQTIGIFGEGETSSLVPNLRQFEQENGLPKVPVRTVLAEGGPDSAYGDNTGAEEWNLDEQASTGMAPDIKQLDYYFAKAFFDSDVEADFAKWAGDPNGPREMNASFGECEANPTNPVTGNPNIQQSPYGTGLGDNMEGMAEITLMQATIEGRTLFASSGDTGSGCPEVVAGALGALNGLAVQPVPAVNYPCASDYAVCVGGTVVGANGTTYPKSAQAASQTNWTFGGGGSSFYIPAPSFQSKVTAVNLDCISQPDGTPYSSTTQCRGVPDVAALSGDEAGDGYTIWFDGLSLGAGGTSLSSPLTVGMWARIQSAASDATQSKGGLGFADPLIYKQASDADTCGSGAGASALNNVSPTTTPCPNAPSYNRDFFDINQSEDVADEAGQASFIIGQPPSTGVGAGNGFYSPSPGWDYVSGWGSLNVSNFMQDVDGTTQATDAYTGAEQAAFNACTFSGTSPTGNATDLETFQNDPGADMTAATITSKTPTSITATFTVPGLAGGLPSDATEVDFYAEWFYNGVNYYAKAAETSTGFTYTSGSISGASRTNTSSSAATGSADTSNGVITITVPTSEVGKPAAGALLTDPQAYDVIINTLGEALILPGSDSADELAPVINDGGAAESVGVNVVVGGDPSSNCLATLPSLASTSSTSSGSGSVSGSGSGSGSSSGSGGSNGVTNSSSTVVKAGAGEAYTNSPSGIVVCSKTSRQPFTHIRSKSLNSRQLKLSGISVAFCPKYIVKVSLAIAKVRGNGKSRRCSFLNARHRFGRYGSCTPRSYLRAVGTQTWSFVLHLRLSRGVYHLWEHAVDNKGVATRNTAGKYVWFRIR